MKKIFILLSVLIFCISCTRIDNVDDLDIIVNSTMKNNNNVNTTSLGYQYYLPLGVSRVYDKDYNQKFKYNDTDIYLYVDIVSYYYRNSLNFNEEELSDNYYYSKLNNNEKIGYVSITKENEEKYFVKIVYNYAKIETYVSENNLNSVLANSLIILDSIKYNDNLIKKLLEDEYFSSVDKEYKINKPSDAESKFSEYLSEYVQEEETVISDLPDY